MRDLGEELGLLGSSLYSHIDGKDQLLVEVIARGGAMFQEVADEAISGDGSATKRLGTLISGHVRILVENGDEATTFLNEARFLPADARREVLLLRDRYEGAFRRLLAEGAAAGEFTGIADIAMASTFILSVLNALVRWYRPDGRLDTDEIAAMMCDFVLEGIT